MAVYSEFFATNSTAAGGFSGVLADNAGGPRWSANGGPIVTKTSPADVFAWVYVSPTRTILRLVSGTWVGAQAGDRVCMIVGTTRKLVDVTNVSGADLELAGTWVGTTLPTTVRVGGVALASDAAGLKTFMQRMLAGTYAATRAWRLNLHRSGTDWAPPDIDSSLITIGPAARALTVQGFLVAAGDLATTESRPKIRKVGGAGEKVMLALSQPATQMRFYDIDFEFQPVTTGFGAADVVSAVLVTQPGYTFCRSKISVTATPNCPVQVLRFEDARQTVRTCWIIRPAAAQRISGDSVRVPSSCIFVTHTPDYFAFVNATLLGNLLDGPDSGETAGAYYNCGIHIQAGSRHQVLNNIFRKQPTGVLVERYMAAGVPSFPTLRFERNTLIGTSTASYGLMLKWDRTILPDEPFQDILIANNLFVRINSSRAVGITSDGSATLPRIGVLGYGGFNTFHDTPSAFDAGLLYDTCEEHRFQIATAALFVDENNNDFRLAWPDVELGINSALQIGGRLNSGSANFENRTDPGACSKQLF